LLFELFTGIVRVQGSVEGNRHSIIEDLPAASLLQTPGARADATTWCDDSGHVWLFAGEGYDDNASDLQPKLLNDLWMLNTSRLQWNVIHIGRIPPTFPTNNGENTKTVSGKESHNGPNTVPVPRKRAASCGVPGIVFVIFGGIDSNGISLSDTWIYIVPKARWLQFSDPVQPPSIWFTKISWCDLDSLYVIGSSNGNATQMWKFSLKTLTWINESLYLTDQQHCPDYSLLGAQLISDNSISTVWNGTFYLYQWQIMRSNSDSDSLMFSVDLQRWQSIQSSKFVNNWHGMPILWSDLNSFNEASVSCSSSSTFRNIHDCDDGNAISCSLHGDYRITSRTSWPVQRLHTSCWFYNGNMYVFGGQEVVTDGSKTFFNDLCILQQSESAESNYSVPIITVAIVLITVMLFVFCAFFILRYSDYRRHREKSRDLRIRYIPLRDQTLYE